MPGTHRPAVIPDRLRHTGSHHQNQVRILLRRNIQHRRQPLLTAEDHLAVADIGDKNLRHCPHLALIRHGMQH